MSISAIGTVARMTVVVPGLKASTDIVAAGFGYRVLPHTSDMTLYFSRRLPDGTLVPDSTHAMWQRAAYDYALRYNRRLLRLLGNRADGL